MRYKAPMTYRKVVNQGWTPVVYHTSRGIRTAAIVKQGPKWVHIKWGMTGNSRVPVSELRYMKEMTSKRGNNGPMGRWKEATARPDRGRT